MSLSPGRPGEGPPARATKARDSCRKPGEVGGRTLCDPGRNLNSQTAEQRETFRRRESREHARTDGRLPPPLRALQRHSLHGNYLGVPGEERKDETPAGPGLEKPALSKQRKGPLNKPHSKQPGSAQGPSGQGQSLRPAGGHSLGATAEEPHPEKKTRQRPRTATRGGARRSQPSFRSASTWL